MLGARAATMPLVLVVLAFAPGASRAAIRTISFTFPAPQQPPSLSPEVPIVDTSAYVHSVDVSYDAAAGSVTISESVYDPSYWADNGGSDPDYGYGVNAEMGTTCSDHLASASIDSFGTMATGAATRSGYDGEVDATGTFDGQFYHATLQNPNLAQLDLRCVKVDQNPADPQQGYFAGYAPLKLNAGSATAALRSGLQKRFGPSAVASRAWSACPESEIFAAGSGGADAKQAHCLFEYPAGQLWHAGAATVKVADLSYAVTIANLRQYRRVLSRCTRYLAREYRPYGALVTSRSLFAYRGHCEPQLAGDIDDDAIGAYPATPRRFVVYEHGTDLAGFERETRYVCRPVVRRVANGRRYRMTCLNGLGDRFRYSFHLTR